jgi:hypothetical protein
MNMRTWAEREELVEARGAEYRAGAMTEEQFRAYLFGMRYRGEDIRSRVLDFQPPPPVPSFEDRREAASRHWLENWKKRQHRVDCSHRS